MASSPGHRDRPNEDFVGAAPGVVVLVDGAGIPGTESICRHGVAWYAHQLGAALLSGLAGSKETSVAEALADSIDQVAGRHRHTCDLANPSSPQAMVSIVRADGDTVDHLVLGDIFVALDCRSGAPEIVTDARELDVRRVCAAPLEGLDPASDAYQRILEPVVEALRARRNQPGGFWIAKDDGAVAAEALTGRTVRSTLAGVALFSNGAARFVDPHGLGTWPAALRLLRTRDAEHLLAQLRAAEAAAPLGPASDDATAAYYAFAD